MIIGSNFNYSSRKFLDDRQECESLEVLKKNPKGLLYPRGFEVYCIKERQWYHNACTNKEDSPIWEVSKGNEIKYISPTNLREFIQMTKEDGFFYVLSKNVSLTYDDEKYNITGLFDVRNDLGNRNYYSYNNGYQFIIDENNNIIYFSKPESGSGGEYIEIYPDTLPSVPVASIDRQGFKTISLSWSFDNKPYYSYQVYASQEQGFTPNETNLIFQGKGSAFLHEVEVGQTWYYRVRAINTYGKTTEFSEEISATTRKISDASEYFEEAAIENALIGELDADKITTGKLKGTFIDARNLTVTDGNNEVTFSVDSFGNVSIKATDFVLKGKTISEIVTEQTSNIITNVDVMYYLSTSLTEPIGGSWQTTAPKWEQGKYMWQKTVTTYKNGTKVESDATCINGAKGDDGKSVNIKGSFTNTDELSSVTNPQAGDGYLINGDLWVYDGSKFNNAGQIKGDKGDSGVGISSLSEEYGISDNKNTQPTTWVSSFPEWTRGKYIWTRTKITYSDGSIKYTEPYVDTSWEQIMNDVDNKVDNTQEAVFNALTNNGQVQGIYLQNGKLYINGEYINAKNLKVTNSSGKTTLKIDQNGNVSLLVSDLSIAGKTVDTIVSEQTATNLKSVKVYYYLSTSPTYLSGGSWSLTAPEWINGRYMWQKTVVTLSNGTTSESDATCIAGAKGTDGQQGSTGVSVTKISKRYGTSTSPNIQPTTWYTSFPTWDANNQPYIWTKSVVSYSDGHTTETEPYVDTCWQQVIEKTNNKVDNTQRDVFNALTNNGQTQGIYLDNGKVYLNGTYLKAGTIDGNHIEAETINASRINFDDLTGKTIKGARFFTALDSSKTDGYAFRIYEDGRVYSSNVIQVYGETNDGVYSQLKPGQVTATEYMKAPGFKTENSSLYIGINDVAVPGTGDNADRLQFTEISGSKYFRPCYPSAVRLGSTSYMWNILYSKEGTSTGSDRRLKENIRYIDKSKGISNTVSCSDMLNFIANDYALAQYNYINDEDKKERVSAIAQDLLVNSDGTDNVIGQMLVNNKEALQEKTQGEEGYLSINQTQLLNTLIGAFQEYKKITDKKIEELENKINNL